MKVTASAIHAKQAERAARRTVYARTAVKGGAPHVHSMVKACLEYTAARSSLSLHHIALVAFFAPYAWVTKVFVKCAKNASPRAPASSPL